MFLYLVSCVILLIYYLWRKLTYFSSRGVATVPPVPFFGNLTAASFGRENFVDVVAAGYEKFKNDRYFGIYQYHVPTLVPTDPELLRQIMLRDFHVFPDRGIHIDPNTDPLFGMNLINMRGSKWRSMRAALTPAFSAARLRGMVPLMSLCSTNTVEYLVNHVRDGKTIEIDSIVSPYINDVIASCAFGFAVNTLEDPTNCLLRLGQKALIQDTTQIMKFFGYENFPALMKFLGVRVIEKNDADKFAELFKSALKSRRDKETAARPDFIQTLIDAAQGKLKEVEDNNNEVTTNWTKKFTDDDLVAQAVLFYVAGYDTTANMINFFLHEVSAADGVQERLVDEISNISGDLYDSVQKMEYLDCCVNETLRKWPIVGAYDRRSSAAYDFGPVTAGGKQHFVGDPDLHIWIPAYSIHHDARYWPEPETFDPERFSPANRGDIIPYTYMPFGNGPRHCLGSRFAIIAAKVFIVQFLSKYRVSPTSKKPLKLAPLAFVARPTDPIKLYVQPR